MEYNIEGIIKKYPEINIGVLVGTGQVDIGKTSLQTYGGITVLLGIFIIGIYISLVKVKF
jgi:hypothetical protein